MPTSNLGENLKVIDIKATKMKSCCSDQARLVLDGHRQLPFALRFIGKQSSRSDLEHTFVQSEQNRTHIKLGLVEKSLD